MRDCALQIVEMHSEKTREQVRNLIRLDGNVMESDEEAIDAQGPGKNNGVVTPEVLIS